MTVTVILGATFIFLLSWTTMALLPLRKRNRLAAQRRLQGIALTLFEDKGFGGVTMQDVAQAGGVSESTLYRYFGTKEALVVWDEYDLDTELVRRFHQQPPVPAFRDALISTFTEQGDLAFLLRRVQFLYATPPVHAAAIQKDLEERAELAAAFAAVGGRRKASLQDDVSAGSCMAALDAAINHWQQSNGEKNLAELLKEAFAAIEHSA
jgi:AcrR family transcriptional regulator